MSENANRISRKATREAAGDKPFVRKDVERRRTLQRRQARFIKAAQSA